MWLWLYALALFIIGVTFLFFPARVRAWLFPNARPSRNPFDTRYSLTVNRVVGDRLPSDVGDRSVRGIGEPIVVPGHAAKRHQVKGHNTSVSTSHVERQNLTMRMQIRRFTRLTNAFSKKLSNHEAAVALHFLHYNFVRVHGSLGTMPAVAAGVSHYKWDGVGYRRAGR